MPQGSSAVRPTNGLYLYFLSPRLHHQNPVSTSPLSPIRAICPAHLILRYLITSNIRCRAQIMKLLIMQFSPVSCYPPLGPKYFPQHRITENLQPMFLTVTDHVSHPYKTTRLQTPVIINISSPVALRPNPSHGLLVLEVYRSDKMQNNRQNSSGQVISSLQKPLTWYNTHNKHPCPGRIRTPNLSRRVAAYLRLRPRGHRDWLKINLLKLSGFFTYHQV